LFPVVVINMYLVPVPASSAALVRLHQHKASALSKLVAATIGSENNNLTTLHGLPFAFTL
jgi:hypothetical protein